MDISRIYNSHQSVQIVFITSTMLFKWLAYIFTRIGLKAAHDIEWMFNPPTQFFSAHHFKVTVIFFLHVLNSCSDRAWIVQDISIMEIVIAIIDENVIANGLEFIKKLLTSKSESVNIDRCTYSTSNESYYNDFYYNSKNPQLMLW